MAVQAERLKSQALSGDAPETRGGAFVARIKARVRGWREFLHDVRVELRQVTWPSRHEVVVTTFVVIVAVAFFGIFFFGVDQFVSRLLTYAFALFKH